MMKKWLKAFRLRTLPLSLACISMGSFLAAGLSQISILVTILTVVTTVFLQILSNLANDYGDFVNGADHKERSGPPRSVQSGEISPSAMKKAIAIFVVLSLISGLTLLFLSLEVDLKFAFFFLLGIASIAAAIYYTMGSSPYGYAGLGDISVFIFFGLLAICGTYFLHTGNIDYAILLPASTCGLFSVGVLNVNNIRDIESDQKAGKRSIPVRIGRDKALIYHWSLLLGGFILSIVFVLLRFESYWQLLFLLALPLFIKNGVGVSKNKDSKSLDPYLKQLAISTLLFVILFGVGLNI